MLLIEISISYKLDLKFVSLCFKCVEEAKFYYVLFNAFTFFNVNSVYQTSQNLV